MALGSMPISMKSLQSTGKLNGPDSRPCPLLAQSRQQQKFQSMSWRAKKILVES